MNEENGQSLKERMLQNEYRIDQVSMMYSETCHRFIHMYQLNISRDLLLEIARHIIYLNELKACLKDKEQQLNVLCKTYYM